MNTHRFSIAATALSMSLMLAPAAFAQEQPAPAPQDAQQQPATSTIEGELVHVDADAKMLTVKGTDGAEQKIRYTDTTTVQGAQEGVAGLTNAAPSRVRIVAKDSDEGKVALAITVLPKAS